MKGCYTGSQTCHWIFYYNGDIPEASWQTEEEKGSVKGEKTETDWLLLGKDLHFSHKGSTGGAESHKLIVPSHPTPPPHAFIHSRVQEDPAGYQQDDILPVG